MVNNKEQERALAALRRAISQAETENNDAKLSDKRVELFTKLREFGRLEEAKKEAIEAYRISDFAKMEVDILLSVRAVAEIAAELGDSYTTMKYLDLYDFHTQDDPTDYQLMNTVGAWCMMQLYLQDDAKERLVKARKFAVKSLEILESADMDEGAIREDGVTLQIREIDCYRTLATCMGQLGETAMADKYSTKAYQMAAKSGNKNMMFDIVRSWLDYTWKNRMKVANTLISMADTPKRKVEAQVWMADALLKADKIEEGIKVLLSLYDIVYSKGAAEEKEKYPGLLIFAYKALRRENRLKKCDDQASRYYQHDKIADLFNEAGYKESALAHYEMAYNEAETDKQKRAALLSCAETCSDLKKYKKAVDFFDQLRLLETRMGLNTTDTQISIFKTRLVGDLYDDIGAILIEIERLEKINGSHRMDIVYEAAKKYFWIKEMPKEADRYKQLEKDVLYGNRGDKDEEDGEEEEEEEETTAEDDIDRLEDNWILQEMKRRAKDLAAKNALSKAGAKENMYGESKLMEMCREGTLEQVKYLVEQCGQDVNKPDPAGWTPLSEAVGANKLEIVKYLITKGANAKSVSKTGWAETNFGGGINPLMEACSNGFVDIARWLIMGNSGKYLITATNSDGWSCADFMYDYLRRATRGEESEEDFQKHIVVCSKLLDEIKELQRLRGYPVRAGDPPPLKQKSDDTPQFAKEKEATARAARMDRRKGAAENYRDTMEMIGSRSKQSEKGGKKKGRKADSEDDEEEEVEVEVEELNCDSDDEPLVRPPSSANKGVARRTVRMSSGSSDDEEKERKKEKEKRKRKNQQESPPRLFSHGIIPTNQLPRYRLSRDESTYGLDDVDGRRRSSEKSGRGTSKQTGVQKLMQKRTKQKRSRERGDENGISIVADDDDDVIVCGEERSAKKARRGSDGSQSECSRSLLESRRSSLSTPISSDDRPSSSHATSPAIIHHDDSFTSLSSASKFAMTAVRVIVVKGEERTKLLKSLPSDTDVATMPAHWDKLREIINGAPVEWKMGDDTLDSISVGDLAAMAERPPIQIECIVKREERENEKEKRTLKGEFEKRCDPSDRDSALSDALDAFDKTGHVSELSIVDGAKYSEQTRYALWEALRRLTFGLKGKKDMAKWRIEMLKVEHWELSEFDVHVLASLPIEHLSLRWCSLDDERMTKLAHRLVTGGVAGKTIKTLDLSYNNLVIQWASFANLLNKMKTLNNLILQGCTGIEEGRYLMETIGSFSLRSLTLDENPWLDDGCMEELMNGGRMREGKMNTLKISKCSVRTLTWLEGPKEAFQSLKTLSLGENNGISREGWDRLGRFLESDERTSDLRVVDLNGSSVPASMLYALFKRSASFPFTTTRVDRCTFITAAEICLAFSNAVAKIEATGGSLNLKLIVEEKKVEEVREQAPAVADKLLKINK